jgi:hypothetical protein
MERINPELPAEKAPRRSRDTEGNSCGKSGPDGRIESKII